MKNLNLSSLVSFLFLISLIFSVFKNSSLNSIILFIGLIVSLTSKHKSYTFFISFISFISSAFFFINAPNWLILYLTWQIMGISLYFLLTKIKSSKSTNFFLINKIESVFFMLALAIIYVKTGSFSFSTVPIDASLFLLIAILIRASQFPFSWINNSNVSSSTFIHASLGILILNKFSNDFLFLKEIIIGIVIFSAIISIFKAFIQLNHRKILTQTATISLGILLLLFDSLFFENILVIILLSVSALYFLIETYSSFYHYSSGVGFKRKSVTSLLFLSIISILIFMPLISMTQINFSLILLSLFLSTQLIKLYIKTFSGGIPPKENFETFLTSCLVIISILSFKFEMITLNKFVLFCLISISGFLFSKLIILKFLADFIEKLSLIRLPELHQERDLIEQWGFAFEKIFINLSRIIHKLFSGSVFRDVMYIASSIIVLAVGVMLC